MDDIDISREACEDHANYCRGFGPSTTPDLILALRAALDRDKASGWKAIDRAVALTFANDVLQAKLDRAEADKAAAVEAMRDVCKKTAKIVLEDEAGDLAAILDEYIKSMQTGMHKGRRLDKAAAKSYATAFAERADAVNQMADHVSAAIRTPSAVGRHETPTPPASPDVQALVEAAKRSLQGWLNVEELRLLPDRHRGTGIELAASLHRALASFTGAKP